MRKDNGTDIAENILRLTWLASKRSPDDLTPSQWAALHYYHRANRPSQTLKAFAAYHATSTGSTSQTLKSLVRDGLLIRRTSRDDKRNAQFELTDKGLTTIKKTPFNRFASHINQLPTNTRIELAETIKTLTDIMALSHDLPLFGNCANCRFYKENIQGPIGKVDHYCAFHSTSIEDQELEKRCAHHQPKWKDIADN